MWENGVSIVKRQSEFRTYRMQIDLHQGTCLSGCFIVSNSLQPHGLPATLVCPWDFPGKNTGVGCCFLLQGNLSDPGIEPASPALTGGFFTTEPPGSTPKVHRGNSQRKSSHMKDFKSG